MNSGMRWVSQSEPRPTVVVTFSVPEGRSLVSESRTRVLSSRIFMSRAARNRRSPCSVSRRPRACRWNSGACNSRSSALIWRLTADWLRPRSSPARVNEPASATVKKMRTLSQSKINPPSSSDSNPPPADPLAATLPTCRHHTPETHQHPILAGPLRKGKGEGVQYHPHTTSFSAETGKVRDGEIRLEGAPDGDESDPVQPLQPQRHLRAMGSECGERQADLPPFRARMKVRTEGLPGPIQIAGAQVDIVILAVAANHQTKPIHTGRVESRAIAREIEGHLQEAAIVFEAHAAAHPPCRAP